MSSSHNGAAHVGGGRDRVVQRDAGARSEQRGIGVGPRAAQPLRGGAPARRAAPARAAGLLPRARQPQQQVQHY